MEEANFEEFQKISRLSRNCVITEKIDGTNAQIYIVETNMCDPNIKENYMLAHNEDGYMIFAGSRNRYITPTADNFGFATWVKANADLLWALGPGRHFGEWWGSGIQRGYGLKNEKRFSLFNTARWSDEGRPTYCHVVPVLAAGIFHSNLVDEALETLQKSGSFASPGFMKPEGVVIYHEAARVLFKKTLEKDEAPKGK